MVEDSSDSGHFLKSSPPLDVPRVRKIQTSSIVGPFLREKRVAAGLSQKTLGQRLQPPVTTQFISNVERGVTPLPPSHVSTLAQALRISENELSTMLEREYAAKLSGRLGRSSDAQPGQRAQFFVDSADSEFMRALYEGFKKADPKTCEAFVDACETILKVQNRSKMG